MAAIATRIIGRHRTGWLLFGLALALALRPADAPATQLSVRLIEASNAEGGMDRALQDIAPLLRNNLPFKTYTLVDAQAVRLPSTGQALTLRGGYIVRCQGSLERLAVTVELNGRVLIQTEIALRPGAPMILGGFSGGRGKMLVVLVAR